MDTVMDLQRHLEDLHDSGKMSESKGREGLNKLLSKQLIPEGLER